MEGVTVCACIKEAPQIMIEFKAQLLYYFL